jgi:serine/alanine adding enzyme
MTVAEAVPSDLATWDDRAVRVPGGHVYQSLAWADFSARTGWRPRHLVFDDGSVLLSLERPWPLVGGAGAYIPRGPVSAGAAPETIAGRLAEATAFLASRGVDVIASDAEVAAATGYGRYLRDLRYRPIREIQPSRHRMSLPLPAGTTDDDIHAGITKSTRQRIRAAEEGALAITRHDVAGWPDDEGLFVKPRRSAEDALDRFYDLLETTGERRGFGFGPRSNFVPWWREAHDRGLLVYLEAVDRADAAVGGLILYRHGQRLTTVHSADRDDARDEHPGLMHLLRWRAIQLAIREGCVEMDLGGVDVAPEHAHPVAGGPMFGLYEHKRSFGAEWVEMTGAHERVIRPWRYALGRAAARVSRVTGR